MGKMSNICKQLQGRRKEKSVQIHTWLLQTSLPHILSIATDLVFPSHTVYLPSLLTSVSISSTLNTPMKNYMRMWKNSFTDGNIETVEISKPFSVLIKILKILLDFTWGNAEAWMDNYWLKEIPIFLLLFSYLFPYHLPPTSCMTTAVDQITNYWQILLSSTDKYILSHSSLIYHSPAAARLQQIETSWLVGLPHISKAHPSMCWLPKNVGEHETSFHNVKTQWSNPILCHIGLCINCLFPCPAFPLQ